MPGKGYFLLWGEDAYVIASIPLLLGKDESGLGEVEFLSQLLHFLGRDISGIPEDCQLVAGIFLTGEDIHDVEISFFHASLLLRRRPQIHTEFKMPKADFSIGKPAAPKYQPSSGRV